MPMPQGYLNLEPCPICGADVAQVGFPRAALAAHVTNAHNLRWMYREFLNLSPQDVTAMIKREWLALEMTKGASL